MRNCERGEPLHSRTAAAPIHGWRVPNWRWRLGRLVAEESKLPGRWLDEWVHRVDEIHMALRSGDGLIDAACLDRVCPDTAEAFRLFLDRGSFRRSELEARLLAGEPSDVIADKCSIRSGVV